MVVIRQIIRSIRLFIHRNDKFYGLSISQIGFVPQNRSLYRLALLHRSASKRLANGVVLNNERLEFLGDSVLGAVVSELLYKFFPNKDEGFLTQLRSKVVSRSALNDLAIRLGLDKAVISNADLSHNKHIYGDVFEAFVGAIFLDQGFDGVKRFVEKFIFPNFVDIKDLVAVDTNYKSQLLEWGQKNRIEVVFETKSYRRGRRDKFCCTVSLAGEAKGKGEGDSKKEAEQQASRKVLDCLSA